MRTTVVRRVERRPIGMLCLRRRRQSPAFVTGTAEAVPYLLVEADLQVGLWPSVLGGPLRPLDDPGVERRPCLLQLEADRREDLAKEWGPRTETAAATTIALKNGHFDDSLERLLDSWLDIVKVVAAGQPGPIENGTFFEAKQMVRKIRHRDIARGELSA